jgi:hypothetical protein
MRTCPVLRDGEAGRIERVVVRDASVGARSVKFPAGEELMNPAM